MKTISVGKKFYASAIAMGCMRIGDLTVAQAEKLVATAIENGVDYFDHADIYAGGKSEQLFGQVLQKHPDWRAAVKVQTKCGIVPGLMYDFSREHILEAVEGSLSRLGLDYVDVLLLHRPDTLMEPDEVAAAFDKLDKSGKVKYFGVSNFNPMQMQLLSRSVRQPLIANQLQFSAAVTGMVDCGLNVNMTNAPSVNHDGSVLEYCRLQDVTIQPWSPLNYGFFQGIFIGDKAYEPLNAALTEIGAKHGLTPAACAFAWILRHPARMQPITGTTNPARLAEICKAGDVVLSREEWYKIYCAAGNKLP